MNHLSRIIKKVFFGTLLLPTAWLGRLIPRRSDLWVFGAWFGNRYADSPRYLFEYVLQNQPGIRAVWLTHSPRIVKSLRREKRKAVLINSLMGFWYTARAGVVFVNTGYADVNRYAVVGAIRVQLWHGIPLKKIHRDDAANVVRPGSAFLLKLRSFIFLLMPWLDDQWELITSTGPVVTERFLSAFETTPEIVVETGTPRTDVILGGAAVPRSHLPDVRAGQRNILYAPTHRQLGTGSVNLFATFDSAAVSHALKSLQARLFIKLHYYQEEQKTGRGGLRGNTPEIRLLTDEYGDINPLLPEIDILITDYSSVYFDYLVLNRPIIFAPFDLEDYVRDDREFYEDYHQATPGPKCRSWAEIMDWVAKFAGGEDSFREAREQARDRYYRSLDAHACRRIIERTQAILTARCPGKTQ